MKCLPNIEKKILFLLNNQLDVEVDVDENEAKTETETGGYCSRC